MEAIQTIEFSGISLKVGYTYFYYPGKYTLSNGNPGYPDHEDFHIHSIHTDDDISKLLDNYESNEKLYEELEEKILPYARDNYNNPY